MEQNIVAQFPQLIRISVKTTRYARLSAVLMKMDLLSYQPMAFHIISVINRHIIPKKVCGHWGSPGLYPKVCLNGLQQCDSKEVERASLVPTLPFTNQRWKHSGRSGKWKWSWDVSDDVFQNFRFFLGSGCSLSLSWPFFNPYLMTFWF